MKMLTNWFFEEQLIILLREVLDNQNTKLVAKNHKKWFMNEG
jgi:hypothetical protein